MTIVSRLSWGKNLQAKTCRLPFIRDCCTVNKKAKENL
jgi:hypothetical protein